VRETRVLNIHGRSITVTLSKSDDMLGSLEPVPKGVVRVPQLHQTIAITTHGDNSAKGFLLLIFLIVCVKGRVPMPSGKSWNFFLNF